MKFTCSQSILSKALNVVSKAVSTRTTLPVLKGILLCVDEDGYLKMSASDQEISITKKFKVNNFESGTTVIPARLFSDIIRKLPNEDVYVEEENKLVKIQCSNSVFRLIGLEEDEFPYIEDEEENTCVTIKSEMLKNMIKMTAFCASTDEQRKVMTGILLEILNGELNLVASDGFRLAVAHTEITDEQLENPIIPQKVLSEIGKIIQETDTDSGESKEDNKVKIHIAEKKARFEIGDINVYTKLLAGEFLKYRNYIPKDNHIRLTVNRSSLLAAIERASLMAREKKNNLVKMEISDNRIEITSNSAEGEAKESVYTENNSGENLIIGFNSKYMSDALKAIEDDEVEMQFKKSNNPCLITPVEGNAYTYLVFPIRIQSL